MNYKNIKTLGAADNMGGASIRLLYAPVSYFATGGIKKVPTNPTDLEASVTISDNHVFKLGKGFHTIRCIIDTNKLKAGIVGERGGRGIKNEYEGKVSGNTRLMAALQAKMKNDEFIILVPLHDGQYIQLGSEDLPAEMMPEHDTGTIESGVNSMMLKITEFTMRRTFYTGAITTFPEGAGSASLTISAGAENDTVTVNVNGQEIGTVTFGASDDNEDAAFQLQQSINTDTPNLGFTANLQGAKVTVFSPADSEVNYLGMEMDVVLTGTAAVSSTSADHTFVEL